MAAYRTSVHEATGFTPNRLNLDRETRLPVDLIDGLPSDKDVRPTSYDKFVDARAERMVGDFESVRGNFGSRSNFRQDKYDVKISRVPLKIRQ
jgi:hypothetical protein